MQNGGRKEPSLVIADFHQTCFTGSLSLLDSGLKDDNHCDHQLVFKIVGGEGQAKHNF